MIWESLLHQRVSEASHKASEARYDVRMLTTEVLHLRDDLERTLLVNRAMWELLRETRGLTDADLAERITEIDLRDGVRDGKTATPVRTCPTCNRAMGRRHAHCLYCGAIDSSRPPLPGAS